MATTTLFQATKLFRIPNNGSSGSTHYNNLQKTPVSCSMYNTHSKTVIEDLALRHTNINPPNSESSNLQFNQLQQKDLLQHNRYEFGQFIAREASIDQEYWTAAWLRAESHWEDRPNERYAESYKRKFAEQEFNAIKKRQGERNGHKSMCIVTVKKEEPNIKRTVIKSIVATLDLTIRYLLQGETFPGERVNVPIFCHISRTEPRRYGYIANLCVAKSARRQGVATNMMYFALESAKATGVEMVYVHVHRHNTAALEIYEKKIGFKIVEQATPQLVKDKTYLLCMELQKL